MKKLKQLFQRKENIDQASSNDLGSEQPQKRVRKRKKYEELSTKVEEVSLQVDNVVIEPYRQPLWKKFSSTTLIYIFILAVLVVSALMVVKQSFEYREEYKTLNQLNKEHKELGIEWGKMLIEKQTFGSTGQIATRATQQLNMFSPNGHQRAVMTLSETTQ